MSSFMSSFIILIAVLVGATVAVALLSGAQLRTYRQRRARKREAEVAEQVKKQLADMRNSLAPEHERAGQGDYEVEDTGHEAGQRTKESTGELAGQAQGTVGQDADQTRATDAGPWATFHQGSIFDRQGEYDLAVEAYQRAIDSEHGEAAPRAAFNLGILCEERGEYDLAVRAYQRAIDSGHPEWAPKAAYNLGMLFGERGEYDLAKEAYQRAIDSGHSDAATKARLNLGVLFEQLGEYDLAEEAYQQVIDSGHPEVAPEGVRNLRGLPMRFPKESRPG
jgi:tetratricopeptide (TPR) repeat protein